MQFNPWTNIMGLRLCLCMLMGFTFLSLSQAQNSDCVFSLDIEWQKHFGGSNSEILQNSRSLSDGGYIMGGHTLSDDGDVSQNYGGVDYWIIKTDANGNPIWSNNFGGASTDIGTSVVETADQGLLFAGSTLSADVDVSNPLGSFDVWIMKLDANGNAQWDRSYGGTGNDRPEWIENTPDGGIVICGTTSSFDGDINENKGITDALVIKLDAAGNVQWTRTVGGSSEDFANHIQTTTDGGYIVSGGTFSLDGDITINNGDLDAMVFKLDANGNVQWLRTLGGSGLEWANWNIQTADGGYLMTGPTDSEDGDFAKNNGGRDLWLTKLDAAGNTQWSQVFGGSKDDIGNAILETPANGFLIAGHAELPTGDVSNNYGNLDIWLLNCDQNGSLIADYNYGGSNSEMTEDMRFTNDGGIILSGFSESNDFDLTANNGQADFWAIKFEPLKTGISNPDLGEDISLCEPENILLDANVTGCSNCIYQWSDGNTSPARIVNVTQTNTYSVVITDETGCSVSDEIQISLTDLDLQISFENPSGCVDDGMITATGIGGSGNYSYEWSNEVFGPINPNLPGGFYNVTVDDGICTKSELVFLQSQNAVFPEVNLGADRIICIDDSVFLEVDEDLDAIWSTGETANAVEINSEGIFLVTVTNSEGCTAVDDININFANEIIVDLGEDQSSCESETRLTSDLSNVDFLWSNGSTENEILVDESGVYELMVTDEFGCTNTGQIEILFFEPIDLDLGEDLSSCDAVEISSPIEDLIYAWSNGSTTAETQVAETGVYELMITDDNGCTATDEIFVEIFETPEIELGEDISSCDPIELTAVSPGNEIQWSTGTDEEMIIVDNTDWYRVTVTNADGCEAVDSVFVDILSASFIDIENAYQSCQSVILDFSNTNFDFNWSVGSMENMIEFTESGSYEVTVTNDDGCSSIENFTVDIVDELIVELGDDVSSCEEIILTAGQSGLNYNWSDGSDENEIVISTSGLYTVTVTDNMGCSTVDEINVEIFDEVNIELGQDVVSCTPIELNAQGNDLNYMWSTGSTEATIQINESGEYILEATSPNGCSDADTINVEIVDELPLDLGADIVSCEPLMLSAGFEDSNLDFNWSNGENENEINITESGLYALTITDPNGCSAIDEIEIQIQSAIEFDLGEDLIGCGEVWVSANVDAETYTWSNGGTEPTTLADLSGTLTLTITTGAGCESKDSIEVIVTDGFDLNVMTQDPYCNGENTGSINIEVLEAEGTVEYIWSDGSNETVREGLSAGIYQLMVTDEAGCEQSRNIEINEPNEITIELVSISHISCSSTTGSIVVETNGGTGELLQEWSILNGQGGIVVPEEAGIYSLLVTDENGCSATAEYEILESAELNARIELIDEIDCFGNANASVNIEVLSGIEPFTFNWQDDSGNSATGSNSLLTDLDAGEYLVTVLDASGCETTLDFSITQPEQINLTVTGYGSCGDFGYAVPSIAGGQEPYEYAWSNGATTELIAQLSNGMYTLTITDAMGCTQVEETEINNFDEVKFEVINTNASCAGSEDAFISIDVTQGVAPFQYEWSHGAMGPELTDLGGGDYTVFVTDANGCTTAGTVDVREPDPIGLQVNTIGSQGGNNGSIDLLPYGGTAPYTYLWDNGSTSSMRSGLENGTYFVTITDQNGCQLEEEILLTFTVGTSDLVLESFNMYPNPTKGEIHIEAFNNTEESLELEVYNALGQLVYVENNLSKNISLKVDLTSFQTGIYYVRFKSATRSSVAKPIVRM